MAMLEFYLSRMGKVPTAVHPFIKDGVSDALVEGRERQEERGASMMFSRWWALGAWLLQVIFPKNYHGK